MRQRACPPARGGRGRRSAQQSCERMGVSNLHASHAAHAAFSFSCHARCVRFHSSTFATMSPRRSPPVAIPDACHNPANPGLFPLNAGCPSAHFLARMVGSGCESAMARRAQTFLPTALGALEWIAETTQIRASQQPAAFHTQPVRSPHNLTALSSFSVHPHHHSLHCHHPPEALASLSRLL